MNKTILSLRCALVVALAAVSGSALAVDLVGSYQKALRVDPSMLAADEAVAAGREKAVQGSALLKPQVTVSGSYMHVNDKSVTNLPPVFSNLIKSESSGSVHQVSVQLAQPLYNAKAFADNKQLHQQSELAEISYRNSQQDLIQRVAQVYFGVLQRTVCENSDQRRQKPPLLAGAANDERPHAFLPRSRPSVKILRVLVGRRQMALQIHGVMKKAQDLDHLAALVMSNPEHDEMTPFAALASDVKRG